MKIFFMSFLFFLTFGCHNNIEVGLPKSYYIVLIAGQSNTHRGIGLDSILDAETEGIKQLGRYHEENYSIINAKEPLQHPTRMENKIGFGLTFAKNLKNILNDEKDIVIVPCGFGGTGFIDNRWNKGNDLYQDAIVRVDTIIKMNPGSELVAILWHQGEKDVKNINYKKNLDDFIVNIRTDLNADSIPLILGGMVPFWVNQNLSRKAVQDIIMSSTLRHINVGYADPMIPFVIQKENNFIDEIHYDARGQRELGERYFEQYLRITKK